MSVAAAAAAFMQHAYSKCMAKQVSRNANMSISVCVCVCVCAEHSNTSDLLCSFAYLIGKLEDCITCEANRYANGVSSEQLIDQN